MRDDLIRRDDALRAVMHLSGDAYELIYQVPPSESTPALSAALALPEIKALVEAGNVMANALRGDYIVPGSAGKWFEALAALEAKLQENGNIRG